MVNKTFIFVAMALLLISPVMAGEGYKIYTDRVTYDGDVIETPEFWIENYHLDEDGNKVYHIDALKDLYIDENNESNNEKVRLYLPYKIQPDYIQHVNHIGQLVATYFPTNEDWEWENECYEDEDEEDFILDPECEGNVILRVDKIDKGLGSNTFPIGITGPTWSRQGQRYGEFDGDGDRVIISFSNPSLNFSGTDNISICAWANPTDISGTDRIFSQADEILLRFNGDEVEFVLNSFTANDRVQSTNSPVVANIWQFVCGTYNGTTILVYHNAVEVDLALPTGVYGGSSTDLFISDDGNPMNGSIDEVLLYNRSLSQAEITALYNNYSVISTGVDRTGTPSTLGLVLDINFDDYSVLDNSDNENEAINTNVNFGIVEEVYKTLTAVTDYTIATATGLFTIVNTDYQWAWMNASWSNNLQSLSRNSVDIMSGNFTKGVDNVSGKIPTIFTVAIIIVLLGVLVLIIQKSGLMIGDNSEGQNL